VKGKSRRRSDRPSPSDEIARLRGLLSDAQATLSAIRRGEVDAVVVESKLGPRVYTLDRAQFDYRSLIESMNEGALVLTRSALVLYANTHFARMVERPLAQLMGSSLYEVVVDADHDAVKHVLSRARRVGATAEVHLQRPPRAPMPAKLSVRRLPDNSGSRVSLGMVVSDLTEVRRREEFLRSYSHHLTQMQESERRMVATDLGDNITQLLCTILVRCQMLADRLPGYEGQFREEAIEFGKLLRSTANEVHRISTDLRPHGLEILGLVSALRGVVAEFAERMGVSIEVNCGKLNPPLPAGTELAVYRILQEALRNVELHARARHVSVTLKRRGQGVQLAIKDDGIGFDTDDQQAKGMQEAQFGLLSMRERASAVGGSLKVKSATSAGTEVLLNVPLSP
jgi:two-component system NarL family sensor kinase